MSETSRPSTITVGRGKKSHFDEHKQDKQFFRCVGSFSATLRSCQQRSILDQADAAQDSGAIGALLRREGLYSLHLGTWRQQRKQGELDALTPKKRGPKVVVSPLVKQNHELQAINARLTKKLKNAELIIEVQKKWLVRRDKLGYEANTHCDYCVAVCPAGDEAEAFIKDRKTYFRSIVQPLREKQEAVYVVPGSDAEVYVAAAFPHKSVRRIGSGRTPSSIKGMVTMLPLLFQREQSKGLAARYHFRFRGKEVLEVTVDIRDQHIKVDRGLLGKADMTIAATDDSWLRFLAKDCLLALSHRFSNKIWLPPIRSPTVTILQDLTQTRS